MVELADDPVRSSVGGDEGPRLREIEVELIDGDEHLLSDVVRMLRNAGIGRLAREWQDTPTQPR